MRQIAANVLGSDCRRRAVYNDPRCLVPGKPLHDSFDLLCRGFFIGVAVANPKSIGEASEAAILAKLVLRGEIVLLPFGNNQRYDIVLDREGVFVRVQCKTGRIRNGALVFACRSNTYGRQKRSYRGEIDFFAVYCPDNSSVYMVPVNEVPVNQAYLRIVPTKANAPKSTIKWANDFLLT